jgi:hypothetical protein
MNGGALEQVNARLETMRKQVVSKEFWMADETCKVRNASYVEMILPWCGGSITAEPAVAFSTCNVYPLFWGQIWCLGTYRSLQKLPFCY